MHMFDFSEQIGDPRPFSTFLYALSLVLGLYHQTGRGAILDIAPSPHTGALKSFLHAPLGWLPLHHFGRFFFGVVPADPAKLLPRLHFPLLAPAHVGGADWRVGKGGNGVTPLSITLSKERGQCRKDPL